MCFSIAENYVLCFLNIMCKFDFKLELDMVKYFLKLLIVSCSLFVIS